MKLERNPLQIKGYDQDHEAMIELIAAVSDAISWIELTDNNGRDQYELLSAMRIVGSCLSEALWEGVPA